MLLNVFQPVTGWKKKENTEGKETRRKKETVLDVSRLHIFKGSVKQQKIREIALDRYNMG